MKEKKKDSNKSFKFLKAIVISCIIFIVLFTLLQVVLNYSLGIELNPTLTSCVYRFFGTELCATAVIQVVDLLKKKDTEANPTPQNLQDHLNIEIPNIIAGKGKS